MSIVAKALVFATDHHRYQQRKGTRIPYMSHLLNVCKILAEHDCSDEILAAGLLHDVVEDTPVTIEKVETEFGAIVAHLVRGATELDKLEKKTFESKGSWQERKNQTIQFLEHEATVDQLLVSSADKLDNLRSIHADHARIGEAVWKRFSAAKEQHEWYFGEIARIVSEKGKVQPILNVIGAELKELHRQTF